MRWIRNPLWLSGKILALAYIFVGGGLLAITLIPLVMLVPGDRRKRTQSLIHYSFHFYIRTLQVLRIIRLEISGADKLAACSGRIVIANHPSLLDIVILISLIPRIQCIVKHELWSSLLVGKLMRDAGYIRNDLPPELLVAGCKTALDDGQCLIIFPEGTRTVPGALPRFQRGFANIATLTATPIQPVFITCEPPILYKGEPWWRVPPRTPLVRVVVGECLDANSYLLYGQRSIAARKLVESLEHYYAKQVRSE
jgi:1-acyl-sn-glycerol-3-phosphate acyltransferase